MLTRIRRYFVSGLVIFMPVSLTVYLLVLTLNVADNYLGKFIKPYFAREFGFYYEGISLVIFIVLLTLIGFLATNFLGRRLHQFLERVLVRLPFFKQVYPPMKEISNFFLAAGHTRRFKEVVFLEYPRKGVYSIGFITNDTPQRIREKIGQKELYNVFVPSSPGPFTGYVLIVPKRDLIFSDITVEQGIKILVSGGVVNPFLELPETQI